MIITQLLAQTRGCNDMIITQLLVQNQLYIMFVVITDVILFLPYRVSRESVQNECEDNKYAG